MAKNTRPEADPPPTMIIPRGTEIRVDAHGQLSVRAPGNLVIQNSGHYGNLESVSGSIRIEPGVEVEAVSVICPETCYIQGSLTAWRVAASNLHLEDTAQAHIVLQDTQRLEVGKGARLVGNFRSEKELFFLFSRFSNQVRSLPFYRERGADEPEPPRLGNGKERGAADPASLAMLTEGVPELAGELDEPLFFGLMLLERDQRSGRHSPESRRILGEIVKLLKQGDLETLRHTHRTLFSRVKDADEDVNRALELITGYFEEAESPAEG